MNNREKILDAALEVYASQGFRGATTRMIAQEAGVNEVTIFRQFGSKLALIEAAVVHHAQRTVVATLPQEPGDPEEEITHWCTMQMANLKGSRALMRKFMCELQQYPDILARLRSSPAFTTNDLPRYIEELRRQGKAVGDFNVLAAVQMLRGAIFSDAMGRDFQPTFFPEPEEEAPAHYARLFLRAIGVKVRGSSPGETVVPSAKPSHPRSRTHR